MLRWHNALPCEHDQNYLSPLYHEAGGRGKIWGGGQKSRCFASRSFAVRFSTRLLPAPQHFSAPQGGLPAPGCGAAWATAPEDRGQWRCARCKPRPPGPKGWEPRGPCPVSNLDLPKCVTMFHAFSPKAASSNKGRCFTCGHVTVHLFALVGQLHEGEVG